jgi:hypothetical protein
MTHPLMHFGFPVQIEDGLLFAGQDVLKGACVLSHLLQGLRAITHGLRHPLKLGRRVEVCVGLSVLHVMRFALRGSLLRPAKRAVRIRLPRWLLVVGEIQLGGKPVKAVLSVSDRIGAVMLLRHA